MLGFCQEHEMDDAFNMSDVSETSRPLDDHLHGQNQTSHKVSFFARKLKQMPAPPPAVQLHGAAGAAHLRRSPLRTVQTISEASAHLSVNLSGLCVAQQCLC